MTSNYDSDVQNDIFVFETNDKEKADLAFDELKLQDLNVTLVDREVKQVGYIIYYLCLSTLFSSHNTRFFSTTM